MNMEIETDRETGNVSQETYKNEDYIQHERQAPKGHTCCGCCCDTRRAVIVINIISMSFAFLALLSLTLLTTNADFASQLDDDEVQVFMDEMDGTSIGLSIGVVVLGILCNACGIFGAYKFHRISIIVASIWFVVEMIRACVYFDMFGIVMAGFFLYPHIVFYQELSSGLMTQESYPNERQCCECCV